MFNPEKPHNGEQLEFAFSPEQREKAQAVAEALRQKNTEPSSEDMKEQIKEDLREKLRDQGFSMPYVENSREESWTKSVNYVTSPEDKKAIQLLREEYGKLGEAVIVEMGSNMPNKNLRTIRVNLHNVR